METEVDQTEEAAALNTMQAGKLQDVAKSQERKKTKLKGEEVGVKAIQSSQLAGLGRKNS